MFQTQLACRGRVIHVNVVVFCRHRLFHERFVEHDSINLNMIVMFNQRIFFNVR